MCLDCQKEEKEHFVKSVALFYKNKISTQGCLKTKGRKIFINFLVVDTAWFSFLPCLDQYKITIKRPMAWNVESVEYFLFGSSRFLLITFASFQETGSQCILMQTDCWLFWTELRRLNVALAWRFQGSFVIKDLDQLGILRSSTLHYLQVCCFVDILSCLCPCNVKFIPMSTRNMVFMKSSCTS